MGVRSIVRAGEHQAARDEEGAHEQRRLGDPPARGAARPPRVADVDRQHRQQREPGDGVREPPLLPSEPERAGSTVPPDERRPRRARPGPAPGTRRTTRCATIRRVWLPPPGASGQVAKPDGRQERARLIHHFRTQREADAGAAESVRQVVAHAPPPGCRSTRSAGSSGAAPRSGPRRARRRWPSPRWGIEARRRRWPRGSSGRGPRPRRLRRAAAMIFALSRSMTPPTAWESHARGRKTQSRQSPILTAGRGISPSRQQSSVVVAC